MRQLNASPNILALPEGTMAFQLGNVASEKLIIYFPGSGYCLPALPSHFSYLEALFADIRQYGKSIGVLLIVYELAPDNCNRPLSCYSAPSRHWENDRQTLFFRVTLRALIFCERSSCTWATITSHSPTSSRDRAEIFG